MPSDARAWGYQIGSVLLVPEHARAGGQHAVAKHKLGIMATFVTVAAVYVHGAIVCESLCLGKRFRVDFSCWSGSVENRARRRKSEKTKRDIVFVLGIGEQGEFGEGLVERW